MKIRLLTALSLPVVIGAAVWLGLHWLAQTYETQPYTLLEDGLYVGSAVEQPPPGTQAVLNLCGRQDSYNVAACHWEPILEGGDEPTIPWLKRMVEFVDKQRRAGLTTYVHCQAGMNRSATVVTAYLMFEHGWSRDQALAFVQSKRPQAQPNPALMRLLAEWERIRNRTK